MAIVRELLIRLGFQTDKKAINETNQAITGFKTRFAIAATAATYAFSKISQFFGDIATATLDAGELAQSLGLSYKELKSIQQAAEDFRFNDKQIGGILSELQKGLREFQQGFGKLREAAMLRGLKFDPFAGAFESLKVILQYLSQIEDDLDRQKVSADFFGDGLAVKVSNLAKNYDQFTESVAKNNQALKNTPDNTELFTQYEKSVNSLGRAWDSLVQTLAKYVFPILEKVANVLDYIVSFYGTLLSGDIFGFKNLLRETSKSLDSYFDWVADKFKAIGDWARPYVEVQPLQGANGRVMGADAYAGFNNWASTTFPSVTNSIEINVPPGTTQEQAQYIATDLQRLVEDSILNTFYQIQNNNPQVE